MIKGYIVIISSLFFIYSCGINKKQSKKDIIKIMVTTTIPEKISGDHVEINTLDFYISYCDQYILYELPYHKTYAINNRMVYDSIKYDFFIYNANDNFGYCLKSINDSFKIKINSDSILKERAYGGNLDIDNIFKEIKIKSLSKLDSTDTTVTFRYVFNHKPYDSAYFFYNGNLKDVRFSLSKSLDSFYNSKLYKVQLFIKNDNASAFPNQSNFYVNSFEIKKLRIKKNTEIRGLFERLILNEEKEHHFK
jgi:hypothetical protein